jgi:hypothetical protein
VTPTHRLTEVRRRCPLLLRRTVALFAVVSVGVTWSAARVTAAPDSVRTLSGSVTITNHDRAVLLAPSTCEEIGALGARTRVVLRGQAPHVPSSVAMLVASPNSQPASALGPCRLSFQLPHVPRSSSYSLTIAGKRAGTWTHAAMQHRRWTLYFDAQGDSNPATWRLAEVPQIRPGDIPIPKVSAPAGVDFDPIRWRQEWTTTPGTDQRRCASVAGHTDVRSASFIVGNFCAYRRYWRGTLDTSKLYYVPLHPEGRPPLAVTAQSLDDPAEVVSVVSEYGPAWGVAGAFFYATGTVIPHRGRWRLTATAAPNWGCFDLTL